MGLELSNCVISCIVFYRFALFFQHFSIALYCLLSRFIALFHPQIHPQKRKRSPGVIPGISLAVYCRKEVRSVALPSDRKYLYASFLYSTSASIPLTSAVAEITFTPSPKDRGCGVADSATSSASGYSTITGVPAAYCAAR